VLNLCLGADKLIIFFARSTLSLPAGQVGLVVTAGGAGGLLGAVATSALCRRLGSVAVITACSAASGLALLGISVATSALVLLAASAAYFWAIVAASVALRAWRQAIVSRAMLGRVTACWRLGGQGVTLLGGVLAGVLAAVTGSPRPVFAAAGALTLMTAAVAWGAGLRTAAADSGPPAAGTATGPSPGAEPGPGPR
jgi:MFS family permease